MKEEKEKSKIKAFWDKFWFVVWKDDSPKGWIISIIFLFVLIKFIIFPTLSFATGTTLPLAIVESCSMYHQGDLFSNYEKWFDRHETKYENLEIAKEQFQEFSFKKGFNKGDILLIIGAKPEKIEIGDVIIFNANAGNPIIHRIIKINYNEQTQEYTFATIGDNNNGQLSFEKSINENQLVGKAVFKIAPLAGWAKLIFFEHTRSQDQKGFCDEN